MLNRFRKQVIDESVEYFVEPVEKRAFTDYRRL